MIVRLADNGRQLAVDQQLAADAEVDLEGSRIEFDRGGGGLERMCRQAPDNNRCGTLDLAVALADADTRKIAEEGQHVVELPAGEAVVGLVQPRVVEVLGVQRVAAGDGTAEFRRSILSVRACHRIAILEGGKARALFVIARTHCCTAYASARSAGDIALPDAHLRMCRARELLRERLSKRGPITDPGTGAGRPGAPYSRMA